MDVKVVGCLGDEVFLEISGDVSLLVEKYAEMIAAEATPEVRRKDTRVDVSQVVALAKHRSSRPACTCGPQPSLNSMTSADANMLGFETTASTWRTGRRSATLAWTGRWT